MAVLTSPALSVVCPVYNEAAGLLAFHSSLMTALAKLRLTSFEIIYINDGSSDATQVVLSQLAKRALRVKVLTLTRNFGKEVATTAGIHAATGQAVLMLDSDGQHPVELIADFIDHWKHGSKVVVGIRIANQKEGLIKRFGSKLFYRFLTKFSGVNLIAGSSDYRLIDRSVQQEFIKLTERNRITRGLIDWLGHTQDYIYYKAKARVHGQASYSNQKLFKLAIDSVISLSTSPLYIVAYIGAFILPVSVLLGLFMAVEMLIGDPLNLNLTGGAYVLVLMLFLIGILLLSQGIIGLYLSHIHSETKGRPLFVVDYEHSRGLTAQKRTNKQSERY
jgi:glycosyltransferase involved in cell wall biosynthesis